MVNIHVAYSQAINPPSATPVLTRSQIWKGLQRKVRSATEFVPVIVSCKVVSEEGNVVTRDVGFKEGYGQPKVREVCKEYAPTKVSQFDNVEHFSMTEEDWDCSLNVGPRGLTGEFRF